MHIISYNRDRNIYNISRIEWEDIKSEIKSD